MVAKLLLAAALSVAVAAPVVAQATDEPSDEIVPEGVRWELRAYDGPAESIDVLPGTGADLVLESGRATFNAGCDLFFGEYTLEGDAILFGDAMQRTDRPCSDEAVTLQNAYLPLLHQAASWRPYFGAFQLLDASGQMLLEFSETTVDISQRDVDDILARLDELSDDVASLQARMGELERGAPASSDGEAGADGGSSGADAGGSGMTPASAPTAPRGRVEVERRYTLQDHDQARGLGDLARPVR
jgi:heat shock protein HslJ